MSALKHTHILNQLGQNKICINDYCLYLFVCFTYSVIFFLNFLLYIRTQRAKKKEKNWLDSCRFLRSISHFTRCCYFFGRVQQTGKVGSVGSMKSERVLANICGEASELQPLLPLSHYKDFKTRFLNRMPLNYQYKCLFVC